MGSINDTAQSFFVLIERVLRDDLIATISRLTDDTSTGKYKNLVLAQLPKRFDISIPGELCFQEEITKEIGKIECHCEVIRAWRNKLIAHRDLQNALSKSVEPLPPLNLSTIEDALKMISTLMNKIQLRYSDTTTYYEGIVMSGDAKSLIFWLKEGVANDQHRRANRIH